jgi:tmRNA-binding protein
MLRKKEPTTLALKDALTSYQCQNYFLVEAAISSFSSESATAAAQMTRPKAILFQKSAML